MMSRLIRSVVLSGGVFLLLAGSALAASVPRMSSDELRSRLGEENLVVLDARAPHDYAREKIKIAGATRVDPRNVENWIDHYDREQTIVLYCA